jgi:hypothetical protein
VGPGRGERLTGGARQGKLTEKRCSTFQIKNCYFPGSKISQIFTEASSNYEEHISATNTQKSIKDCSQKFKQYCTFEKFQEFYGSG